MSIIKQEISRTIGENDGISQVFIQNTIPDIQDTVVEPHFFNLPLFNLIGATNKYYEQIVDGISVNINNLKTLTYQYSANTSSFSAVTNVIYDIYRIDFNTYDSVLNNLDYEGDDINTVNTTAITYTKQSIATLTSNPLVSLLETGDTISLPNHIITLPSTVKPESQFAEPLLLDKSQYFVDTRFEFIQERNKTLGGYQILSGNSGVSFSYTNLSSNGNFLLETTKNSEIVSGGTFSGMSTYGQLFTYFVAPQKPDIDVLGGQPNVLGQLNTFSPIFSFNNVSDGDYYKLQVTYDVTDITFSSGITFNIPHQEGDPEFIRTFSTPLSPDSYFLYRIGNTKEIINVFGVKQNVTTWGRSEIAFTATDGIYDVSGQIFQDELFGSTVSGATVRFIVVSTTADVELGVDTPFNNTISSGTFVPLGGGAGAEFSAITDSNGNYTVTDVKGGYLVVEVSHPLYETTYSTINISSDSTSVDLTIVLRWGSAITTFDDVSGQLFI